MRFRFADLFKTRSTVAGVVETAVAMSTTMLVSVFFVIALALPDVAIAPTA